MSLCCLSYPDDTEPTYLDEDPIEYSGGPPAERRISSHPTLGGGRVWQDFGAPEVDRQISLRVDWMLPATLAAFTEKFAVVGQVWKWVDHEADEYRVIFRGLKPTHLQGIEAFSAEMTFDVVETREALAGADSGAAAETAEVVES